MVGTFGGHASPDLDVRLLDDHASFQGFPPGSSIFSSQDPFAIRVG